jgi:antitoxin component of MazEF toxin-antitoxin module
MTVLVKKLGGCLAVVIPKAVAREAQLTEGTPLDVTATPEGVLLRKKPARRPRRPLIELVARIDSAAYRRHSRELAGDRPVGKEVW